MSRSARGGRVTQTRRRVSAPAPAFDSDDDSEEVVSIARGASAAALAKTLPISMQLGVESLRLAPLKPCTPFTSLY